MFAVQDVIHVDATMWAMIVSVIVPPIVGFVTTINQSPAFKAVINVIVNALGAVITTVIVTGEDAIISKHTAITTFFMYIVGHVTYKDFWKSKGITSSYVPVDPAGTVMQPGSLAKVGIKGADTDGFVPDKGFTNLVNILIALGIVLVVVLIIHFVDINVK